MINLENKFNGFLNDIKQFINEIDFNDNDVFFVAEIGHVKIMISKEVEIFIRFINRNVDVFFNQESNVKFALTQEEIMILKKKLNF